MTICSLVLGACGSGATPGSSEAPSSVQATAGVTPAPTDHVTPAPTPQPTGAASDAPAHATSTLAMTPIASAPTGQRDPLLLSPFVFQDPQAQNVDALAVLAPVDWKVTGGVQWTFDWERLAQLPTTVTDPVSGLTVDWLPIQDFVFFPVPSGFNVPIGGNYQGKAFVAPPSDPVVFMTDMWMANGGPLAHLRGLQLTSIHDVPAVAQEFARQFGGPTTDLGAFKVRYQYDRDGAPWEEEVNFALLVTGSPDFTSWYVNFAYTVRGPVGSLDAQAPVISTIVASRATTPQWEAIYRLVQQLFIQGIQQQMADTEAFGRALAQYREQTRALQAQVTQERQASQDHIAEWRGETLQGIQTYVDPFSGSYVQLPNGYQNYYVNAQGQYVAADPGTFDPSTSQGGGWQQLAPRA